MACRLLWGIFGGSGQARTALGSAPSQSGGLAGTGERAPGPRARSQAQARPALLFFALLAPCGLLLWSSSVMSPCGGGGRPAYGRSAPQFPGAELSS